MAKRQKTVHMPLGPPRLDQFHATTLGLHVASFVGYAGGAAFAACASRNMRTIFDPRHLLWIDLKSSLIWPGQDEDDMLAEFLARWIKSHCSVAFDDYVGGEDVADGDDERGRAAHREISALGRDLRDNLVFVQMPRPVTGDDNKENSPELMRLLLALRHYIGQKDKNLVIGCLEPRACKDEFYNVRIAALMRNPQAGHPKVRTALFDHDPSCGPCEDPYFLITESYALDNPEKKKGVWNLHEELFFDGGFANETKDVSSDLRNWRAEQGESTGVVDLAKVTFTNDTTRAKEPPTLTVPGHGTCYLQCSGCAMMVADNETGPKNYLGDCESLAAELGPFHYRNYNKQGPSVPMFLLQSNTVLGMTVGGNCRAATMDEVLTALAVPTLECLLLKSKKRAT